MKELILILTLTLVGCKKEALTQPSSVIAPTSIEALRAELKKTGPTVIMYGASWCGACKSVLPGFQEASLKHKNVRFIYIDSDMAIIKEHDVPYIPRFFAGSSEESLRHKPCVQDRVQDYEKFALNCK